VRTETAKLWAEFLAEFTRIHVYTVDPGAHAIALELAPMIESMGLLTGWFAEGWSAKCRPTCRATSELYQSLTFDGTLILGSQTNFARTQSVLHEARSAHARTIFVFDHWKNFGAHFGSASLPEIIVVPDEIGKQMLLAELGGHTRSRVQVLPHLALQAAEDRVRSYDVVSSGVIAVLLDPTELADDLGYDWRTTLDAVAELAPARNEARILVKPHPRQNTDEVSRELKRWSHRGIAYELFHGETEWLIAAADEVWGMTTIALNVALAAGKPIRSLQIGRNDKGRRASNPHIEPFAITELEGRT